MTSIILYYILSGIPVLEGVLTMQSVCMGCVSVR